MMTRVAVMTDAHANLPALQAALDEIHRAGCEAIYHTGDAISIGPYPAECLDLLLSTPNLCLTMGNHDAWFVCGLPQPRPAWMDDGEVEHHRWTYAQIDLGLKDVIARWPWIIEETFEGVCVTFAHYALPGTSGAPDDAGDGFAPFISRPTPDELDRLFARYKADVICYGHTHVAWDVSGRARYVNPGSLGCCAEALARFVILECEGGSYTVLKCAVPYDDGPLYEAFERRQVPERQLLYQAFFGSRFPP
jgi:predicted phosphodiesterase